jgi:hypothetical protein
VMPQFAGQLISQCSIGVDDPMIYLRKRVLPTRLVGPLSQDFVADGTQVDVEEEISGSFPSLLIYYLLCVVF